MDKFDYMRIEHSKTTIYYILHTTLPNTKSTDKYSICYINMHTATS